MKAAGNPTIMSRDTVSRRGHLFTSAAAVATIYPHRALRKRNCVAIALLAAVALTIPIARAAAPLPSWNAGPARGDIHSGDEAADQGLVTPAETGNIEDHRLRLSLADAFEVDEAESAASDADEASDEPQPTSAPSGHDAAELAKKVANPISNLISVPFQSNFNVGGGVDPPPRPIPRMLLKRLNPVTRLAVQRLTLRWRTPDRDQAFQYKLNFQPVIPISLNKDWNVISRTIVPIVAQHDLLGTSSQQGMGDITQSFFFSPKSGEPFIWGVGPVLLLPTATDHNMLGAYRWGMGPTGVILKQSHGFTLGLLANHLWSFARDDNRKEVNATYLQPFFNYTTKSATTFGVSSESTYDWTDRQWTVPLIPYISQIVKIGKFPVSLQLAGQYWVEKPDMGPDWGMRFQIQFLFPK